MTHAYQRVAASTDSGHLPVSQSTFHSLLAHRRAAACPRIEGGSWPVPARALSGPARGIGVARPARTAYILHRDPDGRWFIDQWQQDAASDPRPIAANAQGRDQSGAPAGAHSELCFIIEID